MAEEKKTIIKMLEYIIGGMKQNLDNRTGTLCFIREIEILKALFAVNEIWEYGKILNVFCPEREEEKNA